MLESRSFRSRARVPCQLVVNLAQFLQILLSLSNEHRTIQFTVEVLTEATTLFIFRDRDWNLDQCRVSPARNHIEKCTW